MQVCAYSPFPVLRFVPSDATLTQMVMLFVTTLVVVAAGVELAHRAAVADVCEVGRSGRQ